MPLIIGELGYYTSKNASSWRGRAETHRRGAEGAQRNAEEQERLNAKTQRGKGAKGTRLTILPLAESAKAVAQGQLEVPAPSALAPYIGAGEHATTLARGIVIDQARYDIHYITKSGGAATPRAQFFQLSTLTIGRWASGC